MMTKKILSVLLTAALILSCITVIYAAPDAALECKNIEFTDSLGNIVTELKSEPIFAKVTVKNNSDEVQTPVAVVTSYEDGIMNGIWYEESNSEIQSGESGDISVEFTPMTTGSNTVIKAVVLRDMKELGALSKVATALSENTNLEKILVNGKELDGYSDTNNLYLYRTNSALDTLDAIPTDGGEKIETTLADSFPGINKITVTSSAGTRRVIQIVSYANEDEISELIPIETFGNGSCWNGSKFDLNSSGQYVITGVAGAAGFTHIRYAFSDFPTHTLGERIMKIDLKFTATTYSETKPNGSQNQRAMIYFRAKSGDFAVYPTTELVEGQTYNARFIIDKNQLVHIWYGDEYFEYQLKATDDNSVGALTIALTSPQAADKANTVTYEKAVYTLYPTSYTEVTSDGDVLTADMLSLDDESFEVFADDDFSADVFSGDLVSGETEDTLTVSGTADANDAVSFMLLDSAALSVDDADADTALKNTVDAYNSNIDSKTKMSKNEIFYFATVNAGNDGNWSVEIPMMGTDRKDIAMFSSSGDKAFINYASVEYRKNIIPVLKEKAKVEDGEKTLSDGISEYITFISDKTETYQSISDKTAVASLARPGILALDEKRG